MSKFNFTATKTYLALGLFVAFWIITFAFVFPTKIFRKKVPKVAWCFDQVWGQKWNFFTQPHLYNDRLVFVVKKSANTSITDSIDVLKLLWKDKQNNAPFNTKEDILDHIMLRQNAYLREAIENAKQVAKVDSNYYTKKDADKIVSSMVENSNNGRNILNNIEAFGKLMLQKHSKKISDSTSYKILFYTDYIKPYNNQTSIANHCVIDFESSYKYFK